MRDVVFDIGNASNPGESDQEVVRKQLKKILEQFKKHASEEIGNDMDFPIDNLNFYRPVRKDATVSFKNGKAVPLELLKY